LARVDEAPEITAGKAAVTERASGLSSQHFFTSNPQLSVQPGLRNESRATRPEGQLTLSQSFNLGGLGAARAAVARNETERQRWQLQVLRKTRRVEVAEAWLATWSAQETVHAADEARVNAEELHARLKGAARGGGVTRVEVATAAAFAAEASAFHLEWEGRLVDAGTRLSRLLGLPSIATVGDRLPELPTADLSLALEERFPEVRLIAADVSAEQERLAESRAQWATQLQVSVQAGHEAPGQWFGNVGLGATLPAFER